MASSPKKPKPPTLAQLYDLLGGHHPATRFGDVGWQPQADVVVMAAAVADFRPATAVDRKIKKHDGVPEIVLEPTPDILAGLGARKPAGQILVGFAAETDDLAANAQRKLTAKHLDLIVANDVGAAATGFQHDTNAVTLFAPDQPAVEVPLADKRTIATAVIDRVVALRRATTD